MNFNILTLAAFMLRFHKTILGIKKNEVKNVEKLFEEVKELVILTIFIASGIQCWDVFACA